MTDELRELRDRLAKVCKELEKYKGDLEKQQSILQKTGLSASINVKAFDKDGKCYAEEDSEKKISWRRDDRIEVA